MSVAQLNAQPVSVLHQIRIEFFSFEKRCLESYLESVLDSLKNDQKKTVKVIGSTSPTEMPNVSLPIGSPRFLADWIPIVCRNASNAYMYFSVYVTDSIIPK